MRPRATNLNPRASCPLSQASLNLRRASSTRATTNPPASGSSPHPHPLHQLQWHWPYHPKHNIHPHTHPEATPAAHQHSEWHARKDLKAKAPQEHAHAHVGFSQQAHMHEFRQYDPDGWDWHTPAGAVHPLSLSHPLSQPQPHSHSHPLVDTRVRGPDLRVRGPDLRGQHTQKNLWHAQKLAWTANWPHSEQWPSGVIGREQTGLLSIFRSALNLAWRICGFFWLPRYFSKARTSVAPNVDRGVAARLRIHTGAPPSVITPTSDSIQTSSSSPPAEKKNNGLTFALTTLSSVIRNIPGVALLNSFIDPLLDITGRIEQTSANEEQLNALANRIARLAPIISGIAEKNPQQGESFVQALQSELQSITKDLEAARSRGKLDQFFDGTDGAAAIHKHQANLSRLITDYTLVAVISNSGQELERSKLQESK